VFLAVGRQRKLNYPGAVGANLGEAVQSCPTAVKHGLIVASSWLAPSPPPMSFFSNASGVNILGGTFYSAAQGINIQNNLQLAIQGDESHRLVGVGAAAAQDQEEAQTMIEDRLFTGPQRSGGYRQEAERFSPYGAFQSRRNTIR
jgi:hypothetical protein